MYENSIQNRCKIDARKSDAKSMKNDAKMEPKWEPKSDQKLKISEKKGIKKLMQKFDAKKKSNPNISADFGGFWIDFWGVAGGRGEDFIAYISRHLHHLTRATPEGCGGCGGSKNNAKSKQK